MWTDLAAHAVAHLGLAGSAMALALAVGLPVGALAGNFGSFRGLALGLASVGRTLPSLAVLMLLLPLLGVGATPAIIALALLAIPPIVIAVDLGIRGVPAGVLDAAAGMGMTATGRFFRVVAPLALPVSFSGVRTAAIETIASATLATFIGAGGLGDDIVRGLQTNDPAVLLAGAIAVAVLALAVELALGAVGRVLEARA
ncbi:MAG TPA: ABC transporter permease subunit [Candidatus Baltobacteraceae bacterium]